MKNLAFLFSAYLFTAVSFAADKPTLRIGMQATGTLAWELLVLQDQTKGLDFQIETQALATAEAGKIALQSGAVDMILSDWIWVSRMRGESVDLTFYPYSTTSGALMVSEQSSIQTINDLNGKRLGIAGGELDKNWLLLRALAQKNQLDLNIAVEKTFGAPPLINEQLRQSRVDAALNYWHFGVQLEGQGFRQLIDGKGMLTALGISENVPTLGYVFKQSWANSYKDAVKAFFVATKNAKQALCTSETVWQKVLPLIHAENAVTQTKLRQRYCEGNVLDWGKPEQQAAEKIYTLLRAVSHNQLTGKAEHLQPGTFWLTD